MVWGNEFILGPNGLAANGEVGDQCIAQECGVDFDTILFVDTYWFSFDSWRRSHTRERSFPAAPS